MSIEVSQRSKLRNTAAREQSKDTVSADAVALLLGLAESPQQHAAASPPRTPSPVASSEAALLPTQTKRKLSSATTASKPTNTSPTHSEGRSSSRMKKRKVSPPSPVARDQKVHKDNTESPSIRVKEDVATTKSLSPSSRSLTSQSSTQSSPPVIIVTPPLEQSNEVTATNHINNSNNTTATMTPAQNISPPTSLPNMSMTQTAFMPTPPSHNQVGLETCFPDSQTVSHIAAVEQQIRRQMVLTELQAAVVREQRFKQVNAILSALSAPQRSNFMNALSSSFGSQLNPAMNSFQTVPPPFKAQWSHPAAAQMQTHQLLASLLRQPQIGHVANPFQQHQIPYMNSNMFDMGGPSVHALPTQISAFMR